MIKLQIGSWWLPKLQHCGSCSSVCNIFTYLYILDSRTTLHGLVIASNKLGKRLNHRRWDFNRFTRRQNW